MAAKDLLLPEGEGGAGSPTQSDVYDEEGLVVMIVGVLDGLRCCWRLGERLGVG